MPQPASPAAGTSSAVPSSGQRPEDDDLKPYVITQEIGKGSFATVYKGYHQTTHDAVAIKAVSRVLTPKLLDNLKSEIDILKQLSYKHITSLTDIVHSPTHIHLIMEFCAGGDLSQYIKRRGRIEGLQYSPSPDEPLQFYPHPRAGGLEERCVRCFLRQIGRALKFLRKRDLIHRDIKPQNLLLAPASAADHASGLPLGMPLLKVADFGFARILPNQMMAETLCGSPLYMAPEILRYEKYDARADLWSVGAVLYEMSVGKPPFRAQNHIDLLRKIEQSKGIKFPDEDESHPAHPLHPMNPKSPTYQPGMGNTRLEEKMAQVVAKDMKILMRRLLVRNPVERASFEEFFASEALKNSKFTKSATTESSGLGDADPNDGSSSTPSTTRPIPRSTRVAPAAPLSTLIKADSPDPAKGLTPRGRARLEAEERRRKAHLARIEREAKMNEEQSERGTLSRTPPSNRSPRVQNDMALPPSPRTRPQMLPEPEPQQEREQPRRMLDTPNEAPPPVLLEPKAIPPARVAFRRNTGSDFNGRRESYGREGSDQTNPRPWSGNNSPRGHTLLETAASIIPGESEEDGRIRQEYVLVGNTKAVEFDRAVDEIRANRRRPLQDRHVPLTPLTDDPPRIVDLTNSPQSMAPPTTFPPRPLANIAPGQGHVTYSPPLAGALQRALNIASKTLFGSRKSSTSYSPPAKKAIIRDRERMEEPLEDPAEEELLVRLEELAQKTQVLANWADEMYEYVKGIPQKPLSNPKKFFRKEGETDRAAQRRQHAEVEGEWNAVTCVAVYMLLMGFSQKGIDALKRHQAHLEMKFPDEEVGVSEGFELALVWFKNNFIKCNERASRVRTWLPVEFEANDCTWLDQLVYDRALQLSRTAARKELLDQASSPDECERLYEESLWCLYALRDEIMKSDNPFLTEDRAMIDDWISKTKTRLQRCQARQGMSRPDRVRDARADDNLEDTPR